METIIPIQMQDQHQIIQQETQDCNQVLKFVKHQWNNLTTYQKNNSLLTLNPIYFIQEKEIQDMLQIYFIKKKKLQSKNNQTMPAY